MNHEEGTLHGALVTGNFVIRAQMPNGKNMEISGYLYEGESVESASDRIHSMHDILDIQRTRSEIPELEAKRDQMQTALGQMREVLEDLSKKQRDGAKLSSQDKMTLQNMTVNIEKVKEDLVKGEKAIAEAKAKVARV